MQVRAASIGLLLSSIAVSAFAQDTAFDIRGCGTVELTVIDRAGDLTIFQGVARGVVDSLQPGGPFDKTTYDCRNVINASPAGAEFDSRCVFVDRDGHKFFGASSGTPKAWRWRFMGGTGKWEGIGGGGESHADTAYARLSPLFTGACWRSKGAYTLKKM